MAQLPNLDQAARYRIQFVGRTTLEWTDWLSQVSLSVAAGGEQQPAITTLTGLVRDQPALFGLLAQIRDLSLPLLLVQYLDPTD